MTTLIIVYYNSKHIQLQIPTRACTRNNTLNTAYNDMHDGHLYKLLSLYY